MRSADFIIESDTSSYYLKSMFKPIKTNKFIVQDIYPEIEKIKQAYHSQGLIVVDAITQEGDRVYALVADRDDQFYSPTNKLIYDVADLDRTIEHVLDF